MIEQGDGLVALAPRMARVDHTFVVFWFEAQHERGVVCQELNDSQAPALITFTGQNGRLWRFRQLTVDLWNEKVAAQTIGKVRFKTEAQMMESLNREW